MDGAYVVLVLATDGVQPIRRSTDLRHITVLGPMDRTSAVGVTDQMQRGGYLALLRPLGFDHEARPDDDPEPGDRCKDCGEAVVWLGPSMYDWQHVVESDAEWALSRTQED
jgi:hypothetical protein